MKSDIVNKITVCIEAQTEPEPFSGVVYLTKGDEVLFEGACGFANRSESILNRINTRFQTASGCKVFTALAVCRLVELGLLKFDTLLKNCIEEELTGFSPDIKVHHLLTHSSGITSYFEEDVNPDYESLWRDIPVYKIRNPKDFLPLFQSKSMKFSPGERFDYNDAGFILLGLIVENIGGMKFTEYIQKHIFEPAGMKDSGYFATDQLPERTAYAYIKNSDGTWRTNFFAVPVIGGPDGGAYTTAPDMDNFWKALNGGKLLTKAMTKNMLKARIISTDSTASHYGYGVWINRPDEENEKIFVVGYDPGVALTSAHYVNKGITLTVIGNTSAALWPLYRRFEEILLSEYHCGA